MLTIRKTSLAGAALAAGLLTATLTGAAAAAPSTGEAGAGSAAPTTHCVSPAVPAGATRTSLTVTRCFSSFDDAISYATNGAVRLSAGATMVTQRQLDEARFTTSGYQQPNLTSVVLGVSYQDTGWTGNTWIHTGSYGCDTDPDIDWQNAGPLSGPGGGWDNSIGSALAYSNCTGRYWATAGFVGANIDTGWSGGVMNNAASSIQWY
jgi:hypothetical protein